MSKYPNKIPFDLEKLKAGYQVVTRDERIVIDFKIWESIDTVEVLILNPNNSHQFSSYEYDGEYFQHGEESESDLFLLPKTKTLYLNVFKHTKTLEYRNSQLHETEEIAIHNIDNWNPNYKFIKTLSVEIEE